MARVIVIGGGIGGLTTAIAFCRKNWDVCVYEAAPELHPVGKGIWVPINAMQVLGRLGLADHVAKAGCPLQFIELRTASGALLSTVKLDQATTRYGYSMVSMYRARLVEILANALPGGVLHLGSEFTHFTQEFHQVRAHFKDRSEEMADLLVGADGINSRVRQQLFPKVTLRYSGQTCFRGVSEIALPKDLDSTCREVWGGSDRFGFAAVRPQQIYWFAPQTSPSGAEDALHSRRARLLDAYGRFPDPIPAILAAARSEETIRTDLFDFPPLSRWSKDNVVLLGDAAHAMTPNLGQGGGQAIEDAFALAEQFGRTSLVADALARYERLRMPKVKRIVEMSWRFGQIAHWENPLARWARDAALRWTPSSIQQTQLDELYSLNY